MKRNIHNTRERGNVLVLVVVVIVLMALIGTTYLQVARIQRQVVAEPIDNIDLILESVVQEIKLQLLRDVIAEDGTLFGTDVEPYDHPITNYASTGVDVPGVNGNLPTQANMGQNDDAWLGSTVPYDWASGTPKWKKITTLTGGYYPGSGPTALEREVNDGVDDGDALVVGGTPYDEDQAITAAYLVDTDGDGIGDARFERAPIMLMTGHEYFMAVRIIDASSLINLLTATAITSDGTTTATAIRSYFPTSLDMSRLAVKKAGGTSASIFDRAATFFGDGGLRDTDTTAAINGPGTTTFPTPFGLTTIATYDPSTSTGYSNGTMQAWLDGSRQPGDLAQYVDMLTELLWRGGINDTSRTTELENQLGDAAAEMLGTPYNPNASTAAFNEPVTTASTAQIHFVGDDYSNPVASNFNAIRHMLTTISGYSVYSPNYDNMHGGFGLMGDLVYRETDLNGGVANAQNRVGNELQPALARIFNLGAGYPNATDQNLAAGEFAVAIQEYSDFDGAISAHYNDGTNNYYGLEALPFLREAYMQVGYEDKDLATEPSAWEPVAPVAGTCSHGLVVEIANPFDKPIDVAGANGPNVRLVVIERDTDAVIGTPFDLPSMTIEPIDATNAAPGQHVVAIRSEGSLAFDENSLAGMDLQTDVIDVVTPSAPVGFTTIPATIDMLASIPFDTELGVALQVETPDGWVTYDRLFASGADSMSFPAIIDFAAVDGFGTPGTEPTYDQAYIQKSAKRDGAGVAFLSNQGKTVASRAPDLTAPINGVTGWPQDTGFQGELDSISLDNKGVTGDPAMANFQIPVANRPIFSVAELGWIHMFGFSNAVDGDFPQRFSGADGTGGIDPKERFLRFYDAAHPDNGTASDTLVVDVDGDGTLDLTYAEAVLCEFSTLHPGYDGENNDGDSSTDIGSDDDEQFVYGPANINTMPWHMATFSAPYPGTMTDARDLMLAIQGADGANLPIRGIGQLVKRVNAAAIPASPTTEFDLYPTPEEESEYGAQRYTGIVFDGEEDMKRAQFLLQSLSVRSDIYIAFIVVKGYKSGSFDTTGDGISDVVESARAIVVFDRGRLTGDPATDAVMELGRYRY